MWKLVIIAAIGLLVGCATSYGPKGFWRGGGFSETMLAPDVAQIIFKGNGYTSDERASDYAVLHAAELALTNGYRFIHIDGMTTSNVSSTAYVAGYAHTTFTGNGMYTTGVPAIPLTFNFPTGKVTARFHHELQPGDLDADFISKSIRGKYKLPQLASVSGGEARATAEIQPATPAESHAIAPDLAAVVLSAQRASTSQGCGDVSSRGGGEFVANCGSHRLVIACEGVQCRPVHTER